jgi:hypothetical protein
MAPEAEAAETAPAESPAASSKPVAKNKRGRKKKASQPDEPTPSVNEPLPTVEEPRNLPIAPGEAEIAKPVPATKRKRGRTRKSEAVANATTRGETQDEPERQEQQPANETAQPLSEVPPNSQHLASQARAREDGKENAAAGGDVNKDGGIDAETRPPLQEEPEAKQQKSGKQAGPPQKVQYRVGLSKRSRIAPLLKIVRKQV